MAARTLMIQGTSSSVGKSLLVAALCRAFAGRGVRVAPFKAQNMSNNAAVCADGSEIGRSQAVQAAAAGIEPTADMNPILLKPEADSHSQVVVEGRPWRTLAAREYYRHRDGLWPVVTAALARLRAAYELVIIEGAGSPAEINLRRGEIVNMAVARHAESPVLLVGDIDRGGVFAQLLGTLWLLEPEERGLIRGLVVNKFRGDPSLFDDGVRMLEERSGLPMLGVVPFVPGLLIPQEDSATLDQAMPTGGEIDVAVVRLPRIANFDDLDPLRGEPGVRLRYVDSPGSLGRPAAIILPGTKSTIADLAWLRSEGLAEAIRQLAGQGTAVVGLCGGYQMLGGVIRDPEGFESSAGEAEGLGLLPVETTFEGVKATHQVTARVIGGEGWLGALAGRVVTGYEIHMGRTRGGRPWMELGRRDRSDHAEDGCAVDGGRIWGCYLHGIFGNDEFRRAWLASLGRGLAAPSAPASRLFSESIDRLAQVVERAIDIGTLTQIIGLGGAGLRA
ncbi:MAG: cobyric acid synthase [Isosphaeraceae bacterium]